MRMITIDSLSELPLGTKFKVNTPQQEDIFYEIIVKPFDKTFGTCMSIAIMKDNKICFNNDICSEDKELIIYEKND